jgi:hypothetical protein
MAIFCLGIVGLYVGKQFNDSKGRPYYIISEQTSPGASDADLATGLIATDAGIR